MGQPPKHREAMVRATVALFRQRGYAATGLNDILARSGAPKGSLYHYFPGGKEEIAAAAVHFAGERVRETLEALAKDHDRPGPLIRAYADLLGGWMAKSGFRDGCPLATTLLETTPDSPHLKAAGLAAFASWRAVIERELVRDGVAAERARRLAALFISAIEGSLIQARVEQSARPIIEAADEVATLVDAARS